VFPLKINGNNSHLSGIDIAINLKRATFHHLAVLRDGLLLLQAGLATPTDFSVERGVLIPHFSPLPQFWRLPQNQRNIVSVALSLILRSAEVIRCRFPSARLADEAGINAEFGARTFLPAILRGDYLICSGH